MAATWGRAEIIVTADGHLLPVQVRRMATAAGKEGGLSFRRSFLAALGRQFGRDIANTFRPALQELNNRLSPAFNRLRTVAQNAFRGIRNAMNPVTQRFRNMGQMIRNEVSDWRTTIRGFGDEWRAQFDQRFPATAVTIRRLGRAFGDLGRGLRALFSGDISAQVKKFAKDNDDLRVSVERTSAAVRRSTQDTDRFGSSWKSLPHGFRQFVFWAGLIISGMGTMSVLGSALAGTIVSLATILAGLGAAAGIAVAGFVGLFEEGAKLSAGAQATKDAFTNLGQAFQGLQAGIVENMFANMAGSVNNLTNVLLPSLQQGINNLAASAGANISRIFDALSSPAGVENFQRLLDGFVPILDSITTAAIGFGDALADILVASLPTAQLFAQAIADVATQFSNWTSSAEGQERIRKFFETAERIMPKIVDLAVALGNALANLVTETTLTGADQFITALTDFLPVLGEIVTVVANLNVFGILATALQAIGALLTPMLPALQQFATTLGETLVTAIQTLAPVFAELGTSLAPVITILGELIVALLPPLVSIIVEVIQNVAAWIDMFLALGEVLLGGEEGVKIFGDVVKTVFEIVGGVITATTTTITGVLKAVVALLKGDTAGAFKFIEDACREAFANMGLDFDQFVTWLAQLFIDTKHFFGQIGKAIENFGKTIADVFNGAIKWIKDVIGWFGNLFGAANNASGAVSGARNAGGGGAFASGGVLNGPRRILAGEAGPEAIVPLRRSLSQVDPSVRWLSAIAQGMTPQMASGGIVGRGGPSIVISDNGIVVYEANDPARTANEVVTRLFERAAG
jgi:phage-related protein